MALDRCCDSNTVCNLPRKGKRDLVKERFWRKALERFRSSGKTRAKFCADEGLNGDTLVYWSRVISERDAELVDETSDAALGVFVPIAVTDHGNQQNGGHQKAIAQVVFSEGSIFLFNGIDCAMLKALFQALRETAH
jgi:hypothetical protein